MLRFVILAVVIATASTPAVAKEGRLYESIITGRVHECTGGQRVLGFVGAVAGAVVGASVAARLPGGQYAVTQLGVSLLGAVGASEVVTSMVCARHKLLDRDTTWRNLFE
jgi:hypothetical protein